MFIQTEITPNPNSLKFLPGKKVSNIGMVEITKKDETNNELINDFYSSGKNFVLDNKHSESKVDLTEIEKNIVKILEEKIRPAVSRDGGDIKFKSFKDGIVKVQLQGSCSGCPSSTLTLKQGVQNLLKHYVREVKEVEAI